MNEEALKHAYELFLKDGYNGSIDDFRSLISSNKEALTYSYGLFKRDGYFQSIDNYKNLLGVEPTPETVAPVTPEEQEVKKKEPPVTTESPSEGTSLASPTQPDKSIYEGETSFVQPIKPAVAEGTAIAKPLPKTKKEIQQEYQAYKAVEPKRKAVQAEKEIAKLSETLKEKKKPEEKSYWGNMYDNLVLGINSLDQIVASIPESIINVVAIPQNAVAYATGWDIATNADKVKKDLGLRNILLDKLKEEEEGMKKKIGQYSKENYSKEGVYDNIQNGNYSDAFKILGSNIAQSVPVSIAMMYGGAALSSSELAAAGTLAFQQENREQLEQDNPNMSEIEKNVKSLGMSAAETVFSSIGEGSIGQVYKEIVKKEGADAAKTILRDGLVETYKSALKKYGAPIGLLGEGLEEAATQVTQNVISGKPTFQGVADSFITGAGSGVVFTAPITAIEAKKRVNNLVETYKSKREINDIMKDKDVDVHTIFNVSKQDPITADQIQIANVNKSRDIFEKNLQRQVKEGSITKEDAQQSLYVFGKVQQVSNAVKDLDISNEDKAVVANLLNRRNELKTKIQNKEDVLVVKEKKEIDDINQQISDIVLKSKTEEDAIQEQTTDESVLRTEQPELELPKVVEGNERPEVVTEQETITTEGEKEIVIKFERNLDESLEQNKGIEISNLKRNINKGLGDNMEITPEEVKQLSELEFTILPKNDIDKSDTSKPIILIRKRGTPKLSISEALIDAKEEGLGGEAINNLSDYFEIVDGRHRIKKALSNGEKLNAIVITEKEYENETGSKLYSQEVKDIINDLGVKTIEDGIGELNNKKINIKTEKEYLKETGRDINDDLTVLLEEKQFRDLSDKELIKPVTEITPEVKPASPEAKSLADKIRAAKVGKGKAFDAILGIPVAIWDGSVELIAKTVEAGKSLGDAIKAGIKYIEANHKGKFDAKEYEREIKAGFISGYKEAMQGLQEDVDFASRRKKLWEDRIEELTTSYEKYKATDKYRRGDAKDTEYKRKIEEAKAERDTEQGNIDNAIDKLKDSDVYKNATDIEKEELVRDVRERFDIKEKKAPSPEKLLGQPKPKNVSITMKDFMNKVAKAAKEGAKSVEDRIADAKKKIEDYLESVKDYGNLTRADQVKIRKEMMKVKDEKSLDKAVDKINDIIDNAKTDIIEMSEYKMLREMLLVAKEVKGNIEERRKLIKAAIDNITKSGKVSSKQAGKLLNMINKVNLDSDVQVEKVIEYAEKIFNDAEYAEKLDKANGLKSDLQKLSKSKLKNINLRQLARAFAQIKPSMVENIDVYNDIAEKIKEAVRGSRIIGGKELLKLAKTVNIDDVNTYIEESMQYQRERMLKDKIAEAEEILGKDVSGMSYDDIVKLIDEANQKNEPVDKQKKTIIKEAIKKLFADSSNTIKDIFSTGKNPITGEDLDISESKKNAVKRFMSMDLDLLTPKQALSAVDALNNFIENGSTAGMDSVFYAYEGEANAKQIVKENESKKTSKGKLIAQNLKIYFSDSLGKTMAEQMSSLPLLLDWMFRGQAAGTKISEKSGISSVVNEKSSVQSKMNRLAEDYNKQFYKTKVNGKPFNSTVNTIERGILANLIRTKPGTAEEKQIEFDNNKALIEKTIDALKSGNKKEKELSKYYEQAYNNILKGSKDINDVLNKSNNINISAVDWMQEKWADIYEDLADVSENVYNEVLERELNYTTRKWSRLSGAGDAPPLDPSESLFHGNNNNGVYKKKAGVLEKTKPVTELPKNSKDKPTMYVDLFFDKSNINAMYDALMDIQTAKYVRQVESFFKSSDIEKIIPIKEDREILFNSNGTGRVQEFVRNIRNKQIVSDSEMSKAIRAINGSATMGVAAALGTVFQPLKQVIPAATHALIHGANVFNHLDIGVNADKINFLLNSGYGIGIRGVESLAGVPSLRSAIEADTDPNVGKRLLNFVDDAGKFQLKWLLSSPDLGIARASWLGYYEKALKKQGENIDNIDYKTHKLNKDAADYAQKMVDRQQNVSDKDLQGSFFNSKDPFKQAVAKIAMPFATFRMNQTIRMMSDVITLKDKTSTTEDKQAAALSLTGYAAEMAMFRVVSTLASVGMASLTMYLMGHDETEEEKDKRIKNSIKAQLTGTVSDILSPIPTPAVDYAFVYGVNKAMDLIQNYAMDISEEDRIKLFVSNKSDMLKSLGIFGIAAQRGLNFLETQELIATGHFKDEYGRDKWISQKDRETLKGISVLSFLSNMNLLTADANNITKNAVKYAKKGSSTKEGGETEEDIEMQEISEDARALSKEEAKEQRKQKASVLEKLKEEETDGNKIQVINRKIKEYLMTDEEKRLYNQSRKKEIFKEKQQLKELLGKYKTKSDMKRYDPILYEERFGEESDWYKEHKDEMEIDKQVNEMIQEIKDEQEQYIEGGESGFGTSKFGQNTFGDKKKQKESKESTSSFSYKKTKKW